MAGDMVPAADGSPLDQHQYTVAGLRAYEAIYGRDFVSPGGYRTTSEVLATVAWSPGQRVLDVGCGLGGAAFMMAREYQATVLALDVSRNMIDEAQRRCEAYGLQGQIETLHGDVTTFDWERKFDLVHSREVFLHVADKGSLFARLAEVLKPGGQLLFTDYCRGPGQASAAFDDYVAEFGYDLRTVDELAGLLTGAGFSDVSASDETGQFIEIHERELSELADATLGLSEVEHQELRTGWLAKIDRARRGEQRWGWFQARR